MIEYGKWSGPPVVPPHLCLPFMPSHLNKQLVLTMSRIGKWARILFITSSRRPLILSSDEDPLSLHLHQNVII
ncbi:hypothetical protein SLA2020_420570 [Shorea laevis]